MLLNFIKRNIKIYLRNKTGVFFSFLSALIVLFLMIAFLGDMCVDATVSIFDKDFTDAETKAKNIVILWTLSGIFIVNSFSISISVIGTMIDDEYKHILNRFLAAPVKRINYVLGYVISANIISFIMNIIILLISQIYFFAIGESFILSVESLLLFLLTLIVNIFCASSFSFLVASFIHTPNAWSAFGIFMGTIIGFLAGIYLPFGNMNSTLQNIIKWIPAFEGCSAIRNIFLKDDIPQAAQGVYNEYMGIIVNIGDHTITLLEQNLYVLGIGIIFITVSGIIMKSKKSLDR